MGSEPFRIGITGHRRLQCPGRLAHGLIDTLRQRELIPGEKGLEVYSSLALGADQVLASELLDHFAGRLIVPLPMPVEDYLKDFRGKSTRDGFLRLLLHAAEQPVVSSAPRPACYLAAGEYILSHCDLLIAAWDGKPARGKGGTADIVGLARKRKLPLCWIHTGCGKNAEITFENLERVKGSAG